MMSQQYNIVLTKLAEEGLSDSQAMKTLSIITILFLPGTFVATIFTTDIVSFQNKHPMKQRMSKRPFCSPWVI